MTRSNEPTQPILDEATLATMRETANRVAIVDCLHRYARGMDRHDRELALSAYHSDALDDHVGFCGPVADFLDWAYAYHRGQLRHQHYVTNHHIELDGDQANVESYYLFVATEKSGSNVVINTYGGRYVDRFERRDGRWAIAARVCLPEWNTVSPVASPSDSGAVGSSSIVARDRTDPSYRRPLVVETSAGNGPAPTAKETVR